MGRWIVVGLLSACACGKSGGNDPSIRLTIASAVQDHEDGPILAGALWLPPASSAESPQAAWPLTDPVSIPDAALPGEHRPGQDVDWAPIAEPPADSRRCLSPEDCQAAPVFSVALLVAVRDADGDGEASVRDDDPSSGLQLVAEGDDDVVGIATDYVVTWASAAFGSDDVSPVGWPLGEGFSLMRISPREPEWRLLPAAERERVPIFLLRGDPGSQGLCCRQGAALCREEAIDCPDPTQIE